MKRDFKLKYPKLLGFAVVVILTYLLFRSNSVKDCILNLEGFKYIGTFIAGMMYSFGFSSPLSAGFFLSIKPDNILITGIIGGMGAMLSDLVIFKFVKLSFKEEFKKLKEERIIKRLREKTSKLIHKKAKKTLGIIFAGILIGSPLPDELGIMILAGFGKIRENFLVIISLFLNTLGILTLIWINSLA